MAEKSMVFHHWAHQTKKHLSGGPNIRFDGAKLYSYSTVIGQVVVLENGKRAYVVNSGKYSSTTNRHIGAMLGAIPDGEIIIPLHLNNYFVCGNSGRWSREEKDGCYVLNNQAILNLSRTYVAEMVVRLSDFMFSAAASLERDTLFHNMLTTFRNIMRQTKAYSYTKLLQATEESYQYLIDFRVYGLKRDSNVKQIRVKRFIKAIQKDLPLNAIVDETFGEGSWQAYLDRSKGSRERLRQLKLTDFVHSGATFKSIDWSEYRRLKKTGDHIKYLLEIKHFNDECILEHKEFGGRERRKYEAYARFIKYLGFSDRGISAYHRISFLGSQVWIHQSTTARQLEQNASNWLLEFQAVKEKTARKALVERYRQEISRIIDEDNANYEAECRERREREVKERTARQQMQDYVASRKDYINEVREHDLEFGLRTLYHECLTDGGFYHQGLAFFSGGNALMRWNPFLECAETSKGIKISANECKRLWALVLRWHNNQTEFVPNAEKALGSGSSWAIKAYQNDILIAGCHAIHYSEMEGVARAMGLIK